MRTEAGCGESASACSAGQTGRSKSGPSGLVGTVVAPPTARTPGSAARRSNSVRVVGARTVARRIGCEVEEHRRHQHALGSKPESTAPRRAHAPHQQRRRRPAAPRPGPSASTTMASRRRWRAGAGRAWRGAPSADAELGRRRAARLRHARDERRAAPSAAVANSRPAASSRLTYTRQVRRQPRQRLHAGMPPGLPRAARRPHTTTPTPSGTRGQARRRAPIARRRAVSGARSSPRISMSSATLAHATSTSNPTAPSSSQSTPAASPTRSSCSGTAARSSRGSWPGGSPPGRQPPAGGAPRRVSRDTPGASRASPAEVVLVARAVGREMPRHPDLHAGIGQRKAGGHDADDAEGPPFELDGAADDARIAAEPRAPQSVRQHHHGVGAGRHGRAVEGGEPRPRRG